MSFKRVKVVMLPTNEKAINTLVKCRCDDGEYLSYVKSFYSVPLGEAFEGIKGKATYQGGDFVGNIIAYNHLYFLSDEEIKEGDWYISAMKSIISQHNGTEKLPDGWKKIIATTDKSLVDTIHNPAEEFKHIWELPQPSQSFIEKYVEEYNKGNVITEVMVEYDYRVKSGTIDEHKKGLAGYEYFELKVNPKDNTITIRKIKDSWNREEVIELMAKAFYTDCRVWKNRYQDWEEVDFDEWIEENL